MSIFVYTRLALNLSFVKWVFSSVFVRCSLCMGDWCGCILVDWSLLLWQGGAEGKYCLHICPCFCASLEPPPPPL